MDAVLFDMDDTLYDQIAPFSAALGETLAEQARGLDVTRLFAASRRHSDELAAGALAGEITFDELHVLRMTRAFADLGASITRDQAAAFQRAYARSQRRDVALSPTMREVLDLCAANGPVGLVSVGEEEHQLGKVARLGLGEWIDADRVLITGAVGLDKPDPRLFRLGCERVGCEPARTLFVGDSFGNDVVGAKAAGMPVVWLNRRGNVQPAEPVPDWVVSSEEELLATMREVLA